METHVDVFLHRMFYQEKCGENAMAHPQIIVKVTRFIDGSNCSYGVFLVRNDEWACACDVVKFFSWLGDDGEFFPM